MNEMVVDPHTEEGMLNSSGQHGCEPFADITNESRGRRKQRKSKRYEVEPPVRGEMDREHRVGSEIKEPREDWLAEREERESRVTIFLGCWE